MKITFAEEEIKSGAPAAGTGCATEPSASRLRVLAAVPLPILVVMSRCSRKRVRRVEKGSILGQSSTVPTGHQSLAAPPALLLLLLAPLHGLPLAERRRSTDGRS